MKIETTVKTLRDKVILAGKASSSSTVSGMSEQILFDVSGGKLELTCYDSGRHFLVSTSIDSVGVEDGKVLLEYKTLSSLLRKLDDGDKITIEVKDGRAILRSGKTRLTLDTKNPEGFAVPAVADMKNSITMDVAKFKEMVKGVSFAVSTNDNNKIMTGINLVTKDGKITMTALDGHRIAINDATIIAAEDADLIIEGALLTLLVSVLNGDITLNFSKNFLEGTNGDTRVLLQLIDGKYFSMGSFLSTKGDIKVTLSTKELLAAVDRATILIKEGDKKPIILNLTEDGLTLTIKTAMGESVEDFGAVESTGTIKIGFNPRFIVEALREIPDETVTLEMSNPKAPCVIRGDGYMHLILPVNFN